METSDFFYLILFYVAIAAAYFDRKIERRTIKQFYGAIVGFILSLVLCGSEISYLLMNILINAWIITLCYRKKCHILSFGFTFSYLFYSRQYLLSPFTNVILMSTSLRLTGVAFEVNAAFSRKIKNDELEQTNKLQKITMSEIAFYGINYVGLLGAPYYTYSTYDDYLTLPFKRLHDWKNLCIYKLVSSTMIMILYIMVDYLWPVSYSFTEEFYTNKSLLYRIFYIYPTTYTFLFRIWNALILLECCCCVNGLGVYPAFTKPKCGHGPTKKFDEMVSVKTESVLRNTEFNINTIENCNMTKYHSSLAFGKTIQQWNTTIQFWLYSVIYKNVPYQILKKPATMFISSYWHGLEFGYFASLFFSSIVLLVDKRWQELLKGKKSFQTKFFLQVMKFHLLNNLIASFVWKQQDIIMKYQRSVYYNGIILLLFAYILLLIYEKKKL